MLLYYFKKVEMLLPLNYKALYTLSKRKYDLKTNIYLSSLILSFSVKITKLGSFFNNVN